MRESNGFPVLSIMRINKIELRNFRNYEDLELTPQDGINLFFGKNGSGKTNLLEAIHYCALGKSHRVNHDQNIIRFGQKEASCAVSVQTSLVRNDIVVQIQSAGSGKTVLIDQKKIRRFSDLMGCLRCVIFSPEDLSMIRGGPALRRRFLDMMISQLNRNYFIALQQYRISMEQRNAILRDCRIRQIKPSGMIEDFEDSMVKNALTICETRQRMVHLLADRALDTYHRISAKETENFQIAYHSALKNADHPEKEMKRQLFLNREEDMKNGFTSFGPHRDDLNMSLNRKDLKMYASQGQVRTSALSIKLSQLHVLKEMAGDAPVLLLDDVMSELDKGRRRNLLEEVGATQTFITCSDESDFDELDTHRVYMVSSNDGIAQVEEKNHGMIQNDDPLSEPDFT